MKKISILILAIGLLITVFTGSDYIRREKVVVQPEVLFSQKGFKGSGMLMGSPYQVTRTTNYIDMPLMHSIKPTSGITLLAGPQFSLLLNQKDTFRIQGFENDNIRKRIIIGDGSSTTRRYEKMVSNYIGFSRFDEQHVAQNNSHATKAWKSIFKIINSK
jgi:hypothetical protein